MLPTLAIVGRPNVGKSTLFNRLAGNKKALVHDRPGVTRDRNYSEAEWQGRSFMLVDTGGYDPSPGDPLFASMRTQSDTAMAEADVIIFLVDRQSGITPADRESANRVRAAKKPVIVAVNKCDTNYHEDDAHEFWELGFDEVVPLSAEHARGIFELMDAVFARIPAREDEEPEAEIEGEIRVAVLGRPNIGKSTLLNRLLGQERHVVHDMPGTTMDSTDTLLDYEGTRFRLVDTAGIRRRGRISDRVETIAVSAAIRTIERCHVLMLVIDGAEGVTDQDAALAELITERGRGVLLLINKWDMVREMEDRNIKVLEEEIERKLPHLVWAPVLYISALTGKGCGKVLSVARDVYNSFNQRVATAKLNDFLREAVAAYQPPQLNNHPDARGPSRSSATTRTASATATNGTCRTSSASSSASLGRRCACSFAAAGSSARTSPRPSGCLSARLRRFGSTTWPRSWTTTAMSRSRRTRSLKATSSKTATKATTTISKTATTKTATKKTTAKSATKKTTAKSATK